LTEALNRALAKNLTFVASGNGGFTVTMNVHPDRAAKGSTVPPHTEADAVALRDGVQRILQGATESDSTAAQALTMLVGQTPYGFSDGAYVDRDRAAEAMREAERIAQLLKTKGDGMSPEEFDRLNTDLARFKDDRLFQERLATTIGARGLLDFWADLADLSDGGALQRARTGQLDDFQRNLSLTLAGATQSDSPAMRNWENEVVRLGEERIQARGGQVYGYQIMSSLLRTGDWDNRFLNDYGNALVATEKAMKIPANQWRGSLSPMPRLNFIGEDIGLDPMTGLMTALSASPNAATEFFNATAPADNAQYVLRDRHTFDDSPVNGKDGKAAWEATGAALNAAATGTDPNDPMVRPADLAPAHRQVLDRSLLYLSERGDDFPAEMRDDMAKILTRYSDVVHHSASTLADDTDDPRLLDRHQLLEVSKQISRNQDAYGLLNESMNREMIRDIYGDRPNDPKETLLRAGATVGFLEEARYQALKTDKEDRAGMRSGPTTSSAAS
jgi:predicted RNA-binding Zn ribbon-like protein